MESKSEVKKVDDKCSDCESQEVLLRKGRKSYCRTCWRYTCEFKFRKRLFEIGRPAKGTIGEVFRPAEDVILVYDGSPSSVALINLAANALAFGKRLPSENNTPELPFPFTFVILVILESELNGSPGIEGRQKKHLQSLLKWTNHAERMANGVPFPLLTTCIEMSIKEFHPPEADNYMRFNQSPFVVRLTNPEQPKNKLNESIEKLTSSEIEPLALPFNDSLDFHLMEIRRSLKTKTEDKDFIIVLKKNLIHKIAGDLKISKIILPEDQTSLAVKMFSMMSLGRGCQVADEMSFMSAEDNGITTARPLIDFSDVDLRSYLDTLEEVGTDGLVNKGGKRKLKIDSVERQCDDFIENLHKGYPSTVSTLTRIGGKLQSNSKSSSEIPFLSCAFCKRQADTLSDLSPPDVSLCYGCQHFLTDAHPDKKQLFRNLFSLKTKSKDA